ncbi:MAG: radical SAM protein [Oscillospiraceae bacterium]|jgi:radical SAM protein with 4Fe4S-binding SPASM domain|nr:radical SAM protein [Oscillospiraceae bacterium]MDD3260367.1 radical SAM protein [Oscillospiraceae bacterium]
MPERQNQSFLDMNWTQYREMLKQETRKKRIPLLGTFELTPLCNFSCKMCYVHLRPEQMKKIGHLRTAAEWLFLGRQARAAGTLTLLLTGGEVMTRPDFAEIYSGLSEMGFVIVIYSNGYSLSDEMLAVLRKYPPKLFRITLYGASNETYQALCGVPDGYDRVMKNIHRLLKAKIAVALAFTGTKCNLSDLPAVQKISEKLDVAFEYTVNLLSAVRGAQQDALSYMVTDDDIKKIQFSAIQRTPAEHPKAPPKRAKNRERQPLSKCGSDQCGFWVTWDGKMGLCASLSSIQTKPFEQGFSAAWKALCSKTAQLKLPEECSTCQYYDFCTSCPGSRDADTGSPEMIFPQHCALAKKRYLSSNAASTSV